MISFHGLNDTAYPRQAMHIRCVRLTALQQSFTSFTFYLSEDLDAKTAELKEETENLHSSQNYMVLKFLEGAQTSHTS